MWILCRLKVPVRFTCSLYSGVYRGIMHDIWVSPRGSQYILVRDCYIEETGVPIWAGSTMMVEPRHIIEGNDEGI